MAFTEPLNIIYAYRVTVLGRAFWQEKLSSNRFLWSSSLSFLLELKPLHWDIRIYLGLHSFKTETFKPPAYIFLFLEKIETSLHTWWPFFINSWEPDRQFGFPRKLVDVFSFNSDAILLQALAKIAPSRHPFRRILCSKIHRLNPFL